MTPSRAGIVLALLLVTAGGPLSSGLFGDVFRLDDGTEIEGNIVRELGDLVSIKTTEGKVVTLDRSRIVKVRKTRTPLDEYKERLAELKADDLKGQFAMALWCRDNQIPTKATLHFNNVLGLKPNHEEARAALGHVWIAGDWYVEGSPEAAARRAELAKPLDRKPRTIPKDFRPPRVSDAPKSEPKVVGKDSVQLRLNQSVGKEGPEQPFARQEIRKVLRSLKPAMTLGPVVKADKDLVDGWFLNVRIRVYFVKTTRYYGKVPMENLFEGQAEAKLYRVEAGKKTLVETVARSTVPFGAHHTVDKKEGLQYAYYVTCQTLAAKISRKPFFKKRGAEALPLPEEAESR